MADSLDNSGTSSWYSNNDFVGPAKYIELHSIDPKKLQSLQSLPIYQFVIFTPNSSTPLSIKGLETLQNVSISGDREAYRH